MGTRLPAAVVALTLLATASLAALPPPLFYLPFDSTTTAARSGGAAEPTRNVAGQGDPILDLLDLQVQRFVAGQVGRAYDPGDQALSYECAGNFRPDEGTCSFWLSTRWRGTDSALYSTMFGAADWGMVYKYLDQHSLTFGTAKPQGDLYYDCGGDISAWEPGQWHAVAATWSRRRNQRCLYVDGRLLARAPFPFHREVKSGPLFVGGGCTLYPQPVAHALLDEFALWGEALEEPAVREVYEQGRRGEPLVAATAAPPAAKAETLLLLAVSGVAPREAAAPVAQALPTRSRLSLNGEWHFLPCQAPPAALPPTGWGLARVPGYFATDQGTVGPDARPANGSWLGQPLRKYWVGCYQRAFTPDASWRGRRVLLRCGGVDGLASVYLNDRLLGWLPGWQPEAWDVTAALQPGRENLVTIVLRARSGSALAGIYGDLTLEAGPECLLSEVAIRPHADPRRLEVDCALVNLGPALSGELELAVAPAGAPEQPVATFRTPCRLSAASAGQLALWPRRQHVTASFDWPQAHLWNVDDPYLYRLTATLKVGGKALDVLEPQTFGFRELVRRGADFTLNGKPFHLRGHQIDLAWGDQFPHVEELKTAGLNCLELSGPISCDWYRGLPWHREQFERLLDYCDTHGLIAMPILPDAVVLGPRLSDPAVSALYRDRLDRYLRTFGNHPCIGLWYMHFNLAGYLWYCAPDKLDGSYRPDNQGWRAKEREALAAQALYQQLDTRPLYHHACGALGEVFTSNLYLGPNSPTQEREEWPSRWAQARSRPGAQPFLACEHCCMLICYWFRPRQFPLSVVYAGEPIFDEIAAMYLGPGVYGQVTPELFDLYDTNRKPRGDRTRALIQSHRGYQETKALVGRQSLRAWRTYGVSGIVFNAENWDFWGRDGKPLPMLQMLARNFNDTDLYVAGPGADWPSKDHSCYAGETVKKQVVLLNDLARDLPCALTWQVTDGAGRTCARGKLQAVARAGVPSFYPLQFTAPAVAERTALALTITPQAPFQPETFTLQVFPARRPPAALPAVLLYDPAGETTKLLRRAGVASRPLTARSALSPQTLVVVGRRGYDAGFARLAGELHLEQAVREGLRLLVFEQTTGAPLGLQLEETSTRQVFLNQPEHPVLRGLAAEDFQDWRGQSDLIEAYPPAPAGSDKAWPARCFKWGNRGIVATYVYRKPHYAPFRSLLDCGFDLVQSPLLQAQFGRGTVTLCQLDVTPRYGSEPVATRLVDNLLATPTTAPPPATCSCLGASAGALLKRYGLATSDFAAAPPAAAGTLVVVGAEPLDAAQTAALQAAVQAGTTAVLLPGAAAGTPLAPPLTSQELFAGRLTTDPLCRGLNAGDVFLKSWEKLPVVACGDTWHEVVAPGLVAARDLGRGRLIACALTPDTVQGRAAVKATRLWNALLTNLGAARREAFLTAPGAPYLPNEWEALPPYMSW